MSQPQCPPRPTVIPRKRLSGSVKSNVSVENRDNAITVSHNAEQVNSTDIPQMPDNTMESFKNENNDSCELSITTNAISEKDEVLEERVETTVVLMTEDEKELLSGSTQESNATEHSNGVDETASEFCTKEQELKTDIDKTASDIDTSANVYHAATDSSSKSSEPTHTYDNSSDVADDYVAAPKPLARTSTLPNNSKFKSIVQESNPHSAEKNLDDSQQIENVSEELVDNEKPKVKIPVKSPPPKPRSNPPPKPKLVPPPPPQRPPNFLSNNTSTPSPNSTSNAASKNIPKPSLPPPPQRTTNITSGDADKGTPQSTKAVTRKESASKKIELIKKKGLKIKKRSMDVFKSRSSHGDADDLADKSNADNLRITSPLSPEPQVFQTDHEKQEQQPPAAFNKSSLTKSAEKPKRTPPPRPTLPAALKNRRASEPNTPIGKSSNSHVSRSVSTTVRPILSTAADLQKDTDTQHAQTESLSISSGGDNDITSNASDSVLYEEISNDSETENMENNKNATMTNNGVTSPQSKPVIKPARPPPMQLSDSTMLISSKKRPDADEEASLFDMLKGKEGDKPKTSVDQQMKDFISGELFCIATHDYEPTNFTDISFSSGERILVQKQLDDGILFGRNESGEEGPFPGKFVRLEDS